jgi:hypothetical protein
MGQANISFFAGPQASIARYTIKNVKQPTEFKFGFRGGVGMKVNFENNLYFFPAISYSKTGYKVQFNRLSFPPDSSAKDNNTTLHQVDLDAHLQYDFGNETGHLFIKAGPTFNVTVSGRETFHLNTGETVERKMKLGFYSAYGRILVAFSSSIGYEALSGFYLHLRYDHGLSSMNNADGGPQIIQRVFGLNVGLLLNR